jgi:fucose 4-O-acetylase-like acetyltransferase
MDRNAATAGESLAIDRVKGLLILLIVIGHNSLITTAFPDFRRMIYMFHVQSFFLLSACLSQGLPGRRKLTDKVLRYYVPFVAFLVIYALFFTLAVRHGKGLRELPLAILRCAVVPTPESLKAVAGVYMLWFLPALITFTLFDTGLRKWAGVASLAVAALVNVAMGCLIDPSSQQVPWFIHEAAFMLFPAACARLVWNRFTPTQAFWPATALALASGTILFRAGASFRWASLDVSALVVQHIFLLSVFFMLRGAPLPDALSRFFAFLGRESFVIYLCHTLVFYALLDALRIKDTAGWPTGIGALVATIGLSLAAGRVLVALPRVRSALFPTTWADFRSTLASGRRA